MENTKNILQSVYVVKTDFHANFDSPIFIHGSFESALSQFSKLINENYTIEELLDPCKKMHLNLESGYFEFNIDGAPDNICIEEMTVIP